MVPTTGLEPVKKTFTLPLCCSTYWATRALGCLGGYAPSYSGPQPDALLLSYRHMEGYVGAAPTSSAWKAEILLLYEYPSAPTSKIYLVGFFFRKNGFLLNFHDYLRSQGIRTRCENGCCHTRILEHL